MWDLYSSSSSFWYCSCFEYQKFVARKFTVIEDELVQQLKDLYQQD